MVTLTKPAAGDTEWATEVNDNWTTIEDELNLLTTKGDLLVRGSSSNMRLGVGAEDGQVLQVDSSQPCGLKWGTGGVTDHGALTGLLDDDHTQYPLLAGRGGAPAVTNAEFGYLAGVTSSIQTQLGARPTGTGTINRLAYWTGADTIDDLAAIAANRILVSDANGLPVANAALTATRVPFADANGLLTDTADLVWTGTKLQVGGAVAGAVYTRATIKWAGSGAGTQQAALYTEEYPSGVASKVFGLISYAGVGDTCIPTTYECGLEGGAYSDTTGANSVTLAMGLNFVVQQRGTGNIYEARGVQTTISNYSGTGSISYMKGFNLVAQMANGATPEYLYGFYLDVLSAGTYKDIRPFAARLNANTTITTTFIGLWIDMSTALGSPTWRGLHIVGQNFINTLRGHLRLGTTTDAAAEGDFSTGLTGAARLFYDQSAATAYHYNAGGTVSNQISAGASTGTVFNETGLDIDFRVESTGNANLLLLDAGANTVFIGTNVQPATTFGMLAVKATWSGAGNYSAAAIIYEPAGISTHSIGMYNKVVVSNAGIPSSSARGVFGACESQVTLGNTVPLGFGLYFEYRQNGTGTTTKGVGLYAGVTNFATAGVVTNAIGAEISLDASAGSMPSATGISMTFAGGAGVGIGTLYGIVMYDPTGTVTGNKWGLYFLGSGVGNLLQGWLRLGTAIDAAAQGDLSCGLAGAARFFYDQSAADLLLYSAANVLALTLYGDEYELGFADAAANASAAGRLRRNGNFLTWHNGTSGQSILTQHLATAKGDLLVATAANTLAALAVGATDGRPLIVKAAAGAGVAWCGVGELARDAYPDFVASGASHAKGAVPDPDATSGTTKFLREDATWAVPSAGASDTWVRKTADESVTSSTTLQDDDHLSFSIGENEEWCAVFEIDLGAALYLTGLKVAINTPAGATLNVVGTLSGDDTGTPRTYSRRSSGIDTDLNFTSFTALNNGHLRLAVWVLNGANAGTIMLRWAQRTSSGTALTFRKGSFLEAHKVA